MVLPLFPSSSFCSPVSRPQLLLARRPGGSQHRRRRGRGVTTAIFTGLVQGVAEVSRVERKGAFSTLTVAFPPTALEGVLTGASVAMNGTCLTVTSSSAAAASFDVIEETLRVTNLGTLGAGSKVNFERSARVGDEIGGHTVSGHVHTAATCCKREDSENNRCLTFKVDPRWIKYILPKGFVAVDGVSLTVGEVGPDHFCVYLIPETLRVTTLGERQVGDRVNIEVETQTQVIVDTVERIIGNYLPKELLREDLWDKLNKL